MARQFGVVYDGIGKAITGITANTFTDETSVEAAEVRNELGQVVEKAAYSKKYAKTISGPADGTLLEAGEKLTLGGKDHLIMTSKKSHSNTGFCQADLSVETADNATITTYTPPVAG